MLNFYDYEIFQEDWLVVIINPIEKTKNVIINDVEKLEEFHKQHENEIWVGYNNNHYDQYIHKAILCGFNPKLINDYIIIEHKAGWQYSNLFRKIKMYNYDVLQFNDGGLKSLEGHMGDSIVESKIDFNLKRKLTDDEIKETVKYCTYDVQKTIDTFLKRKESFEAKMSLIEAFKLPISDISKTETQLSAKILGATRSDYSDEFEICFPDCLKLNKYKCVLDWFKNRENRKYQKEIINRNGKKVLKPNNLEIDIAGVPHVFAWGGLHGAIPKYHEKGYFLMIDVTSLYPSLMILFNLYSRSCENPELYKDIYNTNIRMKAEKNPLRPAYKLVCNKTYGGMKDPNNPLYDPLNANNICIHGQLLILMLIEMLEPISKLIQSNTDGLLIKMPYEDTESNRDRFFNEVDLIVEEFEKITGLKFEFDEYAEVFQKDVNNYVAIPVGELYDKKGKPSWKSKGAYVKKLSDLDYDLPIVNKALNNYMVFNIPIEQTINNCNDLREFQKIVKTSSKYLRSWHNNSFLNEKCNRVFASKNPNDTFIGKQKKIGETIEKFANTPDHCFICNSDIKDKKIPIKLDKNYYIKLAEERLLQYGI